MTHRHKQQRIGAFGTRPAKWADHAIVQVRTIPAAGSWWVDVTDFYAEARRQYRQRLQFQQGRLTATAGDSAR